MMDYNQLEALVIEWAQNKGILQKATPARQADKTLEEVEELRAAIADDNREEIADALGDILVTIIIQAKMQNMSLVECLEGAYNIIAKRTGKMMDGQFVKDA
jgi:NTP pyrophosphatase (non-canonical NTP hydrolase)